MELLRGAKCDLAPAVVFPARQTNSLAVIRSLGRRRIPVIGLDDVPLSVGFFSRFCKGMLCPDPRKDDRPFLKFLVDLAKTFPAKGVLFLMDDLFVFMASRYRAELEPYYHFSYLGLNVMEDCIDKRRMTRLARDLEIPIPQTFLLEEDEQPIGEIAREVGYPCIIKPTGKFDIKDGKAVGVYRFVGHYGTKALRAASEAELRRIYDDVRAHGFQVIIQDELPGDADELYSLGAYVNAQSRMLRAFTGHKLRQIPRDFGTCTLAQGAIVPALVEYGRRFFEAIRFRGIAELEFKRDPRDGRYKFLEINPRGWTWLSLATECGVDLPHAAYLDLTWQPVPPAEQVETNVKWMDIAKDVLCFLRYRHGDAYYAPISFGEWVRSLRGPKSDIYFNQADPLPGFSIPLQILYQRLTRRRQVTTF